MTGPDEPPPNEPLDPNVGWAPVLQPPRRFAARPLPTVGSTIAGIGAALVVFGIIVWAGGYAVSGVVESVTSSVTSFDASAGSDRDWLGIVLALAVSGVGYVVAARGRAPLVTAGVVASALGVPTTLVFLTLDTTGGTPVNIDAVFLASIAVWLLSYTVMPGARGRGLYLGLSAVALWIYLIIKISPTLFTLPAALIGRAVEGSDFAGPDPTQDLPSLAAMSFVLAAAYYAIAHLLDRDGRHGAATPLVAAGFPVTVGAFVFAADGFGQLGSGVALVVVSLLLVCYGARARRRFTTWAWGLGIVCGAGLLIASAAPDNDTAAGLLFIVGGVAFVGMGAVLSRSLGERPYPAG